MNLCGETRFLQARLDRDKTIPEILRQDRDETGSKNQSEMRLGSDCQMKQRRVQESRAIQ